MKASKALKPFPVFATDQEAEDFVDTADLSEYDLSSFERVRFEFKPKTATISMRVPAELLDAVKLRAGSEGIPYQRFIRRTLEQALATPEKKRA
jgi:predicted DNA binding CopG/RHH family protein